MVPQSFMHDADLCGLLAHAADSVGAHKRLVRLEWTTCAPGLRRRPHPCWHH